MKRDDAMRQWENLLLDYDGRAYMAFPPPQIDEADGPLALRMLATARKHTAVMNTGIMFHRAFQAMPDPNNMERRVVVEVNPFNYPTRESCQKLADILLPLVAVEFVGFPAEPDKNMIAAYATNERLPTVDIYGNPLKQSFAVFQHKGSLRGISAGQLCRRLIAHMWLHEPTGEFKTDVDAFLRGLQAEVLG